MPSCAIATCKSSSHNSKAGGISLFRFPTDPALAKVWLNVCERADKINLRTAVICSDHFRPDQIDGRLRKELCGGSSRKTTLVKGALPTLNLPCDIRCAQKKDKCSEEREKRQKDREIRKRALERLKTLSPRNSPENPDSSITFCSFENFIDDINCVNPVAPAPNNCASGDKEPQKYQFQIPTDSSPTGSATILNFKSLLCSSSTSPYTSLNQVSKNTNNGNLETSETVLPAETTESDSTLSDNTLNSVSRNMTNDNLETSETALPAQTANSEVPTYVIDVTTVTIPLAAHKRSTDLAVKSLECANARIRELQEKQSTLTKEFRLQLKAAQRRNRSNSALINKLRVELACTKETVRSYEKKFAKGGKHVIEVKVVAPEVTCASCKKRIVAGQEQI